MNKNTGLGRGFDALLSQDYNPTVLLDSGEKIHQITLKQITPNTEQPRRIFDQTALNELAASIKQYGVVQPIVVTPLDNNNYELIAGERRWRAAKLAGLKEVPALVRTTKDMEKLEVALIENVQRVDLSPIEQAISIARLHEQFNLSYSEVAKKLGKAETTISNIVRLLQLPPDAADALQNRKISEGHARSILALKQDPSLQAELLELIQKNDWSVRQAEQYVTAHKQGVQTKQALSKRVASQTTETKLLGKKLGVKVTVYHTAQGGRLELHFKNDQELQDLYKKIS